MKQEKTQPLKEATDRLRLWLGGGPLKYRVRGCRVEMKGGGMGPFWWFANSSAFDTPGQAEAFARRWAETEGGVFLRKAQQSE